MPINDTDQLLVNDGSKTETITFAQFKDGTVLNDSDKFLINDGTKTETITWAQLEDELGPKGSVNTPTVLKPNDGAGSGETVYLKSDKIIEVEGGGIDVCETELIESVAQSTLSEYDQRFTWSDAANFDSVEISGLYPFTAMFDGQANSFYGAQTPGQPSLNGKIIWNAPSGANLSGSVWMCAGDNGADSTYPSPIVYINGSSTPAEQNSKTPAGVGYGFHIYEFKNSGPVTKVEIAPDPATKNAVIMSIGVGNSWLIDAGYDLSGIYPGVVPNDIVGSNIVLTFPSAQGFDCFEPGDVVADNIVWSDYSNQNSNPSYPYTSMFDGNTGNYTNCTLANSTSSLIWEYPKGIPFTTLEISAIGLNQTILINDVEVTNTSELPVWKTGTNCVKFTPQFGAPGPGNVLYKIELPQWQIGAAVAGIWIDGELLVDSTKPPVKIIDINPGANTITVDGGEWAGTDGVPADQNQDETWSNSLTAVGDPYTFGGVQPLNAAAAFDGSDATYALWGATTGSSMTFNTNIENVTTVTIYCGTGSTTPATVQVNELPAQTISGVTGSAFTFTYSNPSTLTFVRVISGASDGSGSQRGLSINYIDVDGKRLVDTAGDTKLVKSTPYDTKLTVDSDKDLAKMTGATFMSDGTLGASGYTQTPYKLVTSEIENVEQAVVEGIAQEQIVNNLGTSIIIDSQGEITAYLNNSHALDEAGVTGITGFWLGYPGSNSRRFGSSNTAGTTAFNLAGDWSGVGAGDIRDKVGIARTVGERYFSDNYSFETWWAKSSYPATGQPQGGVASTGMAKDDEIYGVIFDTPLTRSEATDDIDFRVLTYLDSNLATNEEIANSVSAIGIYDQNGDKVILYGRDDSNTQLTFADPNPDLRYFKPGDVIADGTLTGAAGFAIATDTNGRDVTYPDTSAGDVVQVIGTSKIDMTSTEVQRLGTQPDLTRHSHLIFDLINETSDFTISVASSGWQVYSSNDGVNWSAGFKTALVNQSVRALFPIGTEDYRYCMISYASAGASWGGDLPNGYEGEIQLNQAYIDAFNAPHTPPEIPALEGEEVKVVSTDLDNNKMVVDGGEWSDGSDRELGDWDALMTVSAGVVDNKIHAWNGIYVEDAKGGIEYNGALGTSTGSVMTVEFPVDGRLPAGPLEVLCFPKNYLYSAAAVFVTVNDGAPITINAIDDGFVEIAADASTVSKFEVITDGASNPVLQAVRVNGKIMVDNQFINTGGATHVEYQTNGGKGTIVSVNTDDNTLLIADTGDRDNRWIAENKADTDFYVAGPSIVDEPLLTTNVELQSSEFSTDPDGVDGLKEIIWNLNGVDQPGTTLNPYKPTGLSLNTEYTVKVKHVAQSIGESAWSTSTTFTTGASRSLKEHYVKQIRELQSALEAAEAKPKRGRKKAD